MAIRFREHNIAVGGVNTRVVGKTDEGSFVKETNETTEPDATAAGSPVVVSAAKQYAKVPLLRRQDVCSKILITHVAAMFVIGYVPLLFPLGLVTTLGVVIVCVMALTGPIYVRQLDFKTKLLEQWGTANKVAAVLILVVFVTAYGLLGYWIFFRR